MSLIETSPMQRSSGERLALSLLVLHIGMLGALGRYYAKVQIPLGVTVYPTDLVAILCAVLSFRSLVGVPWDALTKWIIVFCSIGGGWVLIGGFDSTGAGTKAFSFFVYSLFYFIVRGLAQTDDDRWRILRAIGAGTVVAATIGLWQMSTGEAVFDPEDLIETSTGSTRWLPGEFALYGMLAFIAIAMRPFLTRSLDSRSTLMLVPPVILLVLAQHRSGFVALFAALLACGVFLVGSRQLLRGLAKLAIVVTVALVGVVAVFGGEYLAETLSRIQHAGDTSDVNAAWRLLSWAEVGQGIIDRPIGHGFATWDFLFTSEDPLTGSHNSVLDLTYRVGIPGLIAFLAVPITIVMSTRAAVKRSGLVPSMVAVTACAAMFALLGYASLNMVFETPFMSMLFWVLVGLAAQPNDTRVR